MSKDFKFVIYNQREYDIAIKSIQGLMIDRHWKSKFFPVYCVVKNGRCTLGVSGMAYFFHEVESMTVREMVISRGSDEKC